MSAIYFKTIFNSCFSLFTNRDMSNYHSGSFMSLLNDAHLKSGCPRAQKTFCACSKMEAPIQYLAKTCIYQCVFHQGLDYEAAWLQPHHFPPITFAPSPHIQHPPSHNWKLSLDSAASELRRFEFSVALKLRHTVNFPLTRKKKPLNLHLLHQSLTSETRVCVSFLNLASDIMLSPCPFSTIVLNT